MAAVGPAEDGPSLANAHTEAIATAYSDCFAALGMADPDMVYVPSERGDVDGYVTVQGNGQTLGFTVSRDVNGEPVNAPANDETEAFLDSLGCAVGEG